MASPKALAAIALTLIVAAPIILGYAMVADTEETTEWVTESTINSSDLLLNHQTPYTMDMTGAVNNSTILQKQVFPGQGATEWHTVAPAYNSVSSKPTSLPTYTSTSATYSLPSMSTNQYNISYSGNNSIGGPNSGADILVTDYPASNLSLTTSAQPIHFMIELTTDSRTYSVVGPVSTIFARDGASTYAVQVTDSFNNTTVYEKVKTWRLSTDANAVVTRGHVGFTTLNISGSYSFIAPGPSSIGVAKADNTTEYAFAPANSLVSLKNGTAVINGITYTGVNSLSCASGYGTTVLNYDVITASGQYADPMAGWKLPTKTNAATTDYWDNGQLNTSVRFMVNFEANAVAYLGPVATVNGASPIELTYASGTITVKNMQNSVSTVLGNYSQAMIVMDQKEATVYGISSWPPYGAYPTTYNSVTVDYADLSEPFTYVRLQAVDVDKVSFRVDSTTIVAGYFPSTMDKWIYLNELYPSRSLSFMFRSVAVYGDSIQIAGQTYAVNEGKITYTTTSGQTITGSLRGMVVEYIYNDDPAQSYTVSINNSEVAANGSASLYFGGEWSLTTSISLIGEQTSSKVVWQPGKFAFDTESFVGVIVLAAVAAFIGIGIYGARSGAKVGLLLLICGGAALIALTII